MDAVYDGYKGLRLVWSLNWDRVLAVLAIYLSLLLFGYIGTP